MIRWFHRHTVSTGVLAILFLVFTVGIPIVVSSCPMMKMDPSKTSCCPTAAPTDGQRGAVTKATSCCRQTIVLTPNSAVYLQSSLTREIAYDLASAIVPNVTGDLVTVLASAGALSASSGWSPPQRGEHLSILYSSLLI